MGVLVVACDAEDVEAALALSLGPTESEKVNVDRAGVWEE